MISSVTPGRRLPSSIAKAVGIAHATLVPYDKMLAAFEAYGYKLKYNCAKEVADGKRLIAAVLARPGAGL